MRSVIASTRHVDAASRSAQQEQTASILFIQAADCCSRCDGLAVVPVSKLATARGFTHFGHVVVMKKLGLTVVPFNLHA